jgi:DNA repair protein RecO (recombination protein O)
VSAGLLAFVVGGADYGEAHRIVRLLSAEQGRSSALARSAKRSKKRFAGMLEPGTQVRVQLGRGRGDLPVIQDIDRVAGPRRARNDLDRIALLAYGCELCASLAPEDEPAPKLVRLLEVWLELLEGEAAPSIASRVALETKALTFAGIAPRFVGCASCGEPLDDVVVFDPDGGGALHERCGAGRRVRRDHLAQLEALRRTPLHDTPQLAPPAAASLPWTALRAHLGRTLRSRALVDELSGSPPGPASG